MSENLLPKNDAEKAKPLASIGVVKNSKIKTVFDFARRPRVLLLLGVIGVAAISLFVWSSSHKPKPIAPKPIDPNEGLITDPVEIQKLRTEPRGHLAL